MKNIAIAVMFLTGLLFFSTRMVYADVIFSPFVLIGEIFLMILPVIIGIVLIVLAVILILHFRKKKNGPEKKEAVFKKEE